MFLEFATDVLNVGLSLRKSKQGPAGAHRLLFDRDTDCTFADRLRDCKLGGKSFEQVDKINNDAIISTVSRLKKKIAIFNAFTFSFCFFNF